VILWLDLVNDAVLNKELGVGLAARTEPPVGEAVLMHHRDGPASGATIGDDLAQCAGRHAPDRLRKMPIPAAWNCGKLALSQTLGVLTTVEPFA
jgi:hypothetical protein